MVRVRAFAEREQVVVQAWAAFGMDAVVWFAGTEGAVLLAMDAPAAFRELLELVTETDLARVELAATTPGVDLVCERGWYSSTDFWSPALFDEYMAPHIRQLAAVVHRHGKKFGYVMTTGVAALGQRLAAAGVDLLAAGLTVAGGTNALSLAAGDPERIRREVRSALDALAPAHRFILHPVDALFPDTPWAGVQALIAAWREHQGLG